MLTLTDALQNYCNTNNLKLPHPNHRIVMAEKIIREIRKLGTYVPIPKVQETLQVNDYPELFVPIVNKVIKEYYNERIKFWKEFQKDGKKPKKYCQFKVETKDSKIFEDVLTELKIMFSPPSVFNDKSKYKIPMNNPETLIRIGMNYQSKLTKIKTPRKRISKVELIQK